LHFTAVPIAVAQPVLEEVSQALVNPFSWRALG
jgi:hypothetical protein